MSLCWTIFQHLPLLISTEFLPTNVYLGRGRASAQVVRARAPVVRARAPVVRARAQVVHARAQKYAER